MKSVNELLDDVKAKHSIKSDYKLAQFLGLTLGAISHYRHGRSTPDERACQKIADALGMDADVLAAEMLARRATTDEARTMWARVAARLSHEHAARFAVLFAIVFVAQFFGGTDLSAAPLALGITFDPLYIVSIVLLVALAATRPGRNLSLMLWRRARAMLGA